MSFKFLTVDDEPDILEIIKEFLEIFYPNCEVDTALDGKEALEKAMAKKYDIVFTDFMMPNMNGAEFIRAMRESNGPNKLTSCLIITAKGDIAQLELGSLSDTLILDKPIDQNRLHSICKIFLSLANI